MNRFRKIASLLLIATFSISVVFAQTVGVAKSNHSAQKGKIVIVVLDISGSIKNQFAHITDILDKSIVKKRLEVGDYFVLIPFGDVAFPMYSGQILREEDKDSISNTLHVMKADNNWTDIGQALHEALSQIVSLKQQNFNLYEPLVLFITDGDITTSSQSPYYQQKVDEIFTDPLIKNTPLYNGWYYVGIGKDLHDLPEIARLSNREDYLLTIEDFADLEIMLDDWISKIPASLPLEQGKIIFNSFKIENKRLREEKITTVLNDAKNLSFRIVSTYKKTPVTLELLSVKGSFQSEDKKTVVPVKITTEAGKIAISPLAAKTTDASFEPQEEIYGKGVLKISLLANENGLEIPYNFSFEVDSTKSSEILFAKIFWSLLILVIIVFLIAAYVIIKKFMPIKITMEFFGSTEKYRSVSMKIKKRVEFGSKPGLQFKLNSELFAPVVGQIQRLGANKWQIIPRDAEAFENGSSKIPYTLGTSLKLKTKDDSTVSIKFKKVLKK